MAGTVNVSPSLRTPLTSTADRSTGSTPPAQLSSSARNASTTRIAACTAFTPRSGRDVCALRPVSSTSSTANPRWRAMTTASVGSSTTAPSAPHRCTSADVPMLAYSSSTVPATITSPANSPVSNEAAASSAAASPPLVSSTPRPSSRPSPRRTSAVDASTVPTVSRWALNSTDLPVPPPRRMHTTLSRPGATSWRCTSRP